jgi:hypothetical protein
MAKIRWPKSLRQESALLPEVAYLDFINDLKDSKQSGRSVAIVGGAYIDLVLRERLSQFFVVKDKKLMEALFERALQAFASRITLAYALGVFGEAVYHDLIAVKEIRNAFSHSAQRLHFDVAAIAQEIHSMEMPKSIQLKGRPAPKTPRETFILVVELLSDLLLTDVGRRDRGMASEPILQTKMRKPPSR